MGMSHIANSKDIHVLQQLNSERQPFPNMMRSLIRKTVVPTKSRKLFEALTFPLPKKQHGNGSSA